jgi:hypothetical protein
MRFFFEIKYNKGKIMNRSEETLDDISKAGTGFMASLSETIRKLENDGYKENLTPCFDHLSCRVGEIKLYPEDFVVDKVVRFENSSDPDDQSILYAVSSDTHGVKGLYVESYGLYHESLSKEILDKLSKKKAE